MLTGALGQTDLTSSFSFTDGTDGTSVIPACMPPTWDGPLAPGQSYCAATTTGTATPAAVCPSGSTCSIVPGISDTTIYLAIAAVASMFILATMFGGGKR
jgi:hypothetical protein